ELEYSHNRREYNALRLVLVKQGCRGASFIRYGVRSATFPSMAQRVVNVAGAGDTVVAAFVASYLTLQKQSGLREWVEDQSAKSAMRAAACAVAHPLTHAPSAFDIQKMFPDTSYVGQS